MYFTHSFTGSLQVVQNFRISRQQVTGAAYNVPIKTHRDCVTRKNFRTNDHFQVKLIVFNGKGGKIVEWYTLSLNPPVITSIRAIAPLEVPVGGEVEGANHLLPSCQLTPPPLQVPPNHTQAESH